MLQPQKPGTLSSILADFSLIFPCQPGITGLIDRRKDAKKV
jgi:hypothetical protein